MNITEPGWIHEHNDVDDTHDTAHGALLNFLMKCRGSIDDYSEQDDNISSLDGTIHEVINLEERILTSEEQRAIELSDLDDDGEIRGPIGTKFYKEVDRVKFILSVSTLGADSQSGKIVITYQRKLRTAK